MNRMKNNATGEIHITQDIKWTGTDVSGRITNTGEKDNKDEVMEEEIEELEHKIIFEPTNKPQNKELLFREIHRDDKN